ncbi:MAG TPA: copper homeostasis protein CutC [Gemmatimonadales bacterium]
MSAPLIEACVESAASGRAAQADGAGRIELCENLAVGGVTPALAQVAEARKALGIGVFVLIRPRGGDFVYSAQEYDAMERDVAAVRVLGAAGIVIGGLTARGDVDQPGMRRLLAAAGPLPATFHRAFDQLRDPRAALETLIALGFRRVLTSGQAATAAGGIPLLAALVQQARGRIGILAGGAIDETNVARIVRETGVAEIHLRGSRLQRTARALAARAAAP